MNENTVKQLFLFRDYANVTPLLTEAPYGTDICEGMRKAVKNLVAYYGTFRHVWRMDEKPAVTSPPVSLQPINTYLYHDNYILSNFFKYVK